MRKIVACGLNVLGDLSFQRLKIREMCFVSQFVQKTHIEMAAVNVGRKIQQVDLKDRSGHPVDAGANPQIGDAFVRPAVQSVYFNRKYPHQGWAVMFDANVGCGKAKATPHFFTMHDAAVN